MRVGIGFADPVLDSQRVFRAVLDALAHPGRVAHAVQLPKRRLRRSALRAPACVSRCSTSRRPLWLDRAPPPRRSSDYLRFHCGVPLVEARRRRAASR